MNDSKMARALGMLLLIVMTSLIPVSCGTLAFDPRSGIVPEEDRIPLVTQGVEQAGKWRARELSVDYKYTLGPQGLLTMSGAIHFEDLMTYNYTVLETFRLAIIFVDGQGRALRMQGLTSEVQGDFDTIPFRNAAPVPAGSEAFAFTYTGVARSTGTDDAGNRTSFWKYPIR